MKIKSNIIYPVCTALLLSFNSCATYRVQTAAQEGTEYQHHKITSLFWGAAQSPKVLTTPVCDQLGTPGLSEVYLRRNAGQFLMSIITLGIYNPATMHWKCSKPCPKEGGI